jgi:hypothetical protein
MSVPAVGAVLHRRREFLTVDDFDACARLTAEPRPDPLGIAFVLALRAAIAWGGLPDEAVMLGHRAVWQEPLRPAVEYETEMRIVEAAAPRTRYQRVVIGYRTTRDDELLMIEQHQEVLWPLSG